MIKLTAFFVFIFLFFSLSTEILAEQGTSLHVDENEISPTEDLMREHGLLNRLLLIYEHVATRIEKNQPFQINLLLQSSQLVRDFIENYHERLEEDYIFPFFLKTHTLKELVNTLKDQHEAGRMLTDYIISHSNEKSLNDKEQRNLLAHYLRLYIRMFRPHEAREDTILFPAFRKLVSKEEYKRLGETFESIETQKFGEHGFEKIVNQVAEIEKKFGIYNLSEVTPR